MKIISNIKDFYDHGMAFGMDEGIVYERFQTTIYPPEQIKNRHGGVLGFCGEFYETTKLYSEEKSRFGNYYRPSMKDKETVETLIEDKWVPGTVVMDKYNKDEVNFQYYIRPLDINKVDWDGKYAWNRKDYSHWINWLKSLFTEHQAPIFFVDDKENKFETLVNPVTMDYGLQKLMDPVEAFQKLSTFIPSLRPVDDFEMTDEEKGKSKGFDEYSFRNKNTKKKPKKF